MPILLALAACSPAEPTNAAYEVMLTEDCRVSAGLVLHVDLHTVTSVQTSGDLITVTYASETGPVTCTYSKPESRRVSIEQVQP